MTATAIVNNLLEDEGFGFGQQEKAEHWEEVPFGFIATAGTDRIECKWDEKQRGYRFTKFWKDDYTGKPRSCPIGLYPMRRERAEAFLAKQEQELKGWDFRRL